MAKNIVKYEGSFDYTNRTTLNNNLADVSVSTAALTANASTDLANVTGLVTDTLPVGTYRFYIHLATSAGASGGLKVGLKFGTASMLTSIQSTSRNFTASAVVVTQSTTATDAASLVATTSAVINSVIEGTLVVGTAGTLQVQAAQNASNGTDTIVLVGSYMTVTRIGN